MKEGTYELPNCTVLKDTGKAILIKSTELENVEWIPKSMIDDDSEVYEKDTEGTLIVKEWVARTKGWI